MARNNNAARPQPPGGIGKAPVAGWDDADPATRAVLADGLAAARRAGRKPRPLPDWLAEAATPAAALFDVIQSRDDDRRARIARQLAAVDTRGLADSAAALVAAVLYLSAGRDPQATLALCVLTRQATHSEAGPVETGHDPHEAARIETSNRICQALPPDEPGELSAWIAAVQPDCAASEQLAALLVCVGALAHAAQLTYRTDPLGPSAAR